jgi:hypothetical protein
MRKFLNGRRQRARVGRRRHTTQRQRAKRRRRSDPVTDPRRYRGSTPANDEPSVSGSRGRRAGRDERSHRPGLSGKFASRRRRRRCREQFSDDLLGWRSARGRTLPTEQPFGGHLVKVRVIAWLLRTSGHITKRSDGEWESVTPCISETSRSPPREVAVCLGVSDGGPHRAAERSAARPACAVRDARRPALPRGAYRAAEPRP